MTGADVTARSTTVTALTVDRTKPPATTGPVGSKKFAFEIAGKGTLETFQLETKGLSPGPHTLQVRILNDPVRGLDNLQRKATGTSPASAPVAGAYGERSEPA